MSLVTVTQGKRVTLPLSLNAFEHTYRISPLVFTPHKHQSKEFLGSNDIFLLRFTTGSFSSLQLGAQHQSPDPRREGKGRAHLQEAAQAAQVAAGAEGDLVEVLQQQDERGVPGRLSAAQLLCDGEEFALHLGAVQQQHRPGDTGWLLELAARQARCWCAALGKFPLDGSVPSHELRMWLCRSARAVLAVRVGGNPLSCPSLAFLLHICNIISPRKAPA